MGKIFNKLLQLKYAGNSGFLSCLNTGRLNSIAFIAGKFATPPFDGKMYTNEYITIASANVTGLLRNLVFEKGYTQEEYVTIASAFVTGTFIPPFDGKMYESEYLEMTGITAEGEVYLLSHQSTYTPNEYIEVGAISAIGTNDLVI